MAFIVHLFILGLSVPVNFDSHFDQLGVKKTQVCGVDHFSVLGVM